MSAPSFSSSTTSGTPVGPSDTHTDCADGFEPVRNTQLYRNLVEEVIEPDSGLSYQLAKQIYLQHPMGQRIVDGVINLAFSQERTITGIPDDAKRAFTDAWAAHRADTAIKNVARHARIFGVGTLVDLGDGSFKIYDPLLTAGSLVGNLDPLAKDFLNPSDPVVQGTEFNGTNSIVVRNAASMYLAYSQSAMSYAGRSVYFNMLGLLASFLVSCDVDTLVLRKAGVLVAKTKSQGSAMNRLSQWWQKRKASMVRRAMNGNVLAIEVEESIETLNLQNTSDAMTTARNNVISNIATALDAPAVILKNDVLTNGFGEGSEDSKIIAQYVERYRGELEHLFDWMTPRIQALAWTAEWYASFQLANPAYASISYASAIGYWKNQMKSKWPNFLVEPDSEKVKREESAFNAYMQIYEKLQAGIRNAETRRQLAQAIIELTDSDEMKTLLPLPIDLTFTDEDFEEPAPTEFRGSMREQIEQGQESPLRVAPGTEQEYA
ncbi:hypothetical protein WL32_28305 [Burkholderia cepacia]|uniref:hypothetical protein n=1 Tax=Burkholderia cepacia TaxID=292 RepID=UPI00075EC089|nr:hypothetical protein [Burkholderia cepacia]KWB16516.1 hypothetical protein WL32_28305 [Burkholderia cepacia]